MSKDRRFSKEKLRPYVHVALVAVICMVVFLLVWTLAGPGNVRNLSETGRKTRSEGAAGTEEITQTSGTLQDAGNNPAAGAGNVVLPAGEGGTESGAQGNAAGAGEAENTQSAESLPEAGMQEASVEEAAPSAEETETAEAAEEVHYSEWVRLDDGRLVHYNAYGQLDIGWTAVDGEGCYFDLEGTYIPDRDKSGLIALTFDDGPSIYTSQILDILEAYDVRATFLMIGIQVEKNGSILPRMAALGHTLGNHSYDHAEMLDLPLDMVQWEFEATDQLIESFCGERSSVVRFPYGDYTREQTAVVGKPQIYWDVDSLDWDTQDSYAVQSEIWSQLEGGSIVLLHDIYPSTVSALAELVPALLANGYEPVTIEELAASRGYTLEDGVTYFSFKDKNVAEGRVTDQ